MSKGYLIARVRIKNDAGFNKFLNITKNLVDEHGGKLLVRNYNPENKEGKQSGIVTVIEFKNMNQARKFYESKEYSKAKKVRESSAETDLILVEGV